MIKEAYCSKEVSILLKEKGFNESVHHEYHDTFLTPHFHKKSHNFNGYEYANCGTKWFSAPTQQMAMVWLREHGLHINAPISYDYSVDADGNEVDRRTFYIFEIYSSFSGNLIYTEEINEYDSYEEAVEAAIKYSLENLI